MFILELETGFPGGFGKGFDFAMINVTTTVKDHGADVCSLSALGDQGSDVAGAIAVRLGFLDGFVESRGGYEGAACNVVHDLDINVLIGEMHGETGTSGGASYFPTNALVNALPDLLSIDRTHEILLLVG